MDQTNDATYWGVIWDKFREGDRYAFEMIYNEYIDAMYAYGSRITSHHALVEDAIQDLFLDVYTYGTRLRKPESLEFYLYKTLRRIIIRKLKDKNRFSHSDDFIQQFDLRFPLEDANSNEMEDHIRLLQQELKILDSRKRELLFLKFNSGLTYQEIGFLMDCKPDTVKKQVSRVLKLLQNKIKNQILNLFVVVARK